MKKAIYIAAFTFFGLQLQFLVRSFIEINYINLLLKDFDTFSLGLNWQQIYIVHYIFSVLMFLLGAAFGFWQGRYWWKYIYVDKKIDKRFAGKNSLFWKIIKY